MRRSLTLAAALLLSAVASAAASNQEYQIKAAFLYNFAQFVEWPPEETDPSKPFVIGILGRDPFGDAIDSLEKETIHSRPIEVRRLGSIDEADDPDLLYVAEGSAAPDDLDRKSILTVGDGADFVKEGGVIGFVVKGNKVRFVINRRNAEQKGLKINSQLLTLAEKVI